MFVVVTIAKFSEVLKRYCDKFDLKYCVFCSFGQDDVTFNVIGSNSYNTLVEKLVALHAIKAEQASRSAAFEDEQPVDFAAATIASLGVPTPHMKIISDEEFEILNHEAAGKARRKGDEEEAAELLQALALSQSDNEGLLTSSSGDESIRVAEDGILHGKLASTVHVDEDGAESVEIETEAVQVEPVDESMLSTDVGVPDLLTSSIVHVKEEDYSPLNGEEVLRPDFVFRAAEPAKEVSQDVPDESPSLRMWLKPAVVVEDTSGKQSLGAIEEGSVGSSSGRLESPSIRNCDSPSDTIRNEDSESIFKVGEDVKTPVDPLDVNSRDVEDHNPSTSGSIGSSFEHVPSKDDKLSSGTGSGHLSEEAEDCVSSVLDDDEPLYEGEQKLVESVTMSVAGTEPLYEGEDVSAELADGQVSGHGSGKQELEDEKRSVAMTEGKRS